jgi:hypothetical protein
MNKASAPRRRVREREGAVRQEDAAEARRHAEEHHLKERKRRLEEEIMARRQEQEWHRFQSGHGVTVSGKICPSEIRLRISTPVSALSA